MIEAKEEKKAKNNLNEESILSLCFVLIFFFTFPSIELDQFFGELNAHRAAGTVSVAFLFLILIIFHSRPPISFFLFLRILIVLFLFQVTPSEAALIAELNVKHAGNERK